VHEEAEAKNANSDLQGGTRCQWPGRQLTPSMATCNRPRRCGAGLPCHDCGIQPLVGVALPLMCMFMASIQSQLAGRQQRAARPARNAVMPCNHAGCVACCHQGQVRESVERAVLGAS
jgi:hypothetical protein